MNWWERSILMFTFGWTVVFDVVTEVIYRVNNRRKP